jgi:hypothetical protein
MDEVIHKSPNIIIAVDTDDDGCSDGRETVEVYNKHGEITSRWLNRAKVFGGSVAMTAASLIGLGMARGKLLQEVFNESVDTLEKRKINFGAHTDSDAEGSNSGCGAIDRAPEAIVAALKYENNIRQVITILGVDTGSLDDVFTNFRHYVSNEMARPQKYSGSKVMKHILSAGKVIKRLGGHHQERRVVINQVRGHTVNQKLIRDVTGGKGQVFAVDTWRLEDIAAGLFPKDTELQHQALLSELVYTLGTSAVLTKGDLPVDMIQTAA